MTTHLSELVPNPPPIFELQIFRDRESHWRGHLSFGGVRRWPLPKWLAYEVARTVLLQHRMDASGSIVEVGSHP